MEHLLVQGIQDALGWRDASPLGQEFVWGKLSDSSLPSILMTPSRLLDIVTRRQLEPPRLRFFQNGSELRPDSYLRTQVNRRGHQSRLLDPARASDLLDAGVTLVLDAVEAFDPVLEVATRALRWWSRELVQVNAYLTTRTAGGFDLHWDDHDVIVVQVAGEKTWDVRGTSRAAPMFRDAEQNMFPSDEPVWQGVLRPGELIHVPRGFWHQATRAPGQDPFSLHLTFGFTRRTGVDWLAWIADQARDQDVFRRDLDRSGDPAAAEAERARLEAAAVALVRSLPPRAFLAAREDGQAPARHAPALPSDREPQTVVCVTEFPPRLAQDGDTLVVTGGGKKITFRARARSALEALLSGAPVEVGPVSDRVGFDVRPVARALLQAGLCAELTQELAVGYAGLLRDGGS